MKSFTFSLTLACLFLAASFFAPTISGCKKDKINNPNEGNYPGDWEIVLAGTCADTTTMSIDTVGNFSLILQCDTMQYDISGQVDLLSGKIRAEIPTGTSNHCYDGFDGQLFKNGTGSGAAICPLLIDSQWEARKK